MTVLLFQFEPRKSHKNVAVVAHYRAGSTFASVMFSEYPGALYVFEPASSYHLMWQGVNKSLANEVDRSKAFLERVSFFVVEYFIIENLNHIF